MTLPSRPLVISAPEPRTLDLIFTPESKARLFAGYDVHETTARAIAALPDATLAACRYLVGQPALSAGVLARMTSLRCIFNVEGNLLNNMPYEGLFQRGVHVVTTGAVFARPVAEIGLGFALCLARGIIDADTAFREGRELWGVEGNAAARLLSGGRIGIIGFGELGRALCGLLSGFRCQIVVHDPWLPDALLHDHGVTPCGLQEVLETSDMVFVVAAVTSENQGFLDRDAFARMKPGAGLILLSRADVVNFDDLMAAVASGHILAASDVFPEEPLAADHPVRRLPGFLRSAHRAGALDVAFKQMGSMVLDDMALMDRDLPPLRCKRAERETVARMRSRPITTN